MVQLLRSSSFPPNPLALSPEKEREREKIEKDLDLSSREYNTGSFKYTDGAQNPRKIKWVISIQSQTIYSRLIIYEKS